MTTKAPRPSCLVSLLLLAAFLVGGAYLSALPLLLAKAGTATALVFLYGYCAVRLVGALKVRSGGVRKLLGLLLGAATVYLTWAVRLPVFSGWDQAFTLDPDLLYRGVLDRAASIEVSKGFGGGTTEGPSWLMRAVYLGEALAFLGAMFVGAWASGPDDEEPA